MSETMAPPDGRSEDDTPMTAPQVLLRAHGLQAKKSWGQNFLTDGAMAAKIVRASRIGAHDTVLEIGSGLGALTVPLARRAGRVIAVEKDRDLVPLLRAQLLAANATNVEVWEQNILRVDLAAVARSAGGPVPVVGNLPYHLSSQILFDLIARREAIDRCVLMFQRELARRLTAQPGNRTYGRISVMLQYAGQVRHLADVPAPCFYPRPRVDSQVVEVAFDRNPAPPPVDEQLLFRVVKTAFGQRRKTLRNALASPALGLTSGQARTVLQAAHLDPLRRAESLSVAEYVALTSRIQAGAADG